MTVTELNKLPVGTRIMWNRKGVCQGDEGAIAQHPNGARFIQWDDGETIDPADSSRRLRWVKKL